MTWIVRTVFMLLTLSAWLSSAQLSAQEVDSARVSSMVAAEAQVQRGLHIRLGDRPVDPQIPGERSWEVELEHVEIPSDTDRYFIVLKARIPALLHWHAYVIATSGEAVWRLGGFRAPEVIEFAEHLSLKASDEQSASTLGGLFCRLLQPEVDKALLPAHDPADTVDPALAAWWSGNRPSNWPLDEAKRTDDAGWVVQVTTLFRVQNYGVRGHAVGCRFVFDQHGQLVAWATREERGQSPI